MGSTGTFVETQNEEDVQAGEPVPRRSSPDNQTDGQEFRGET